MNSHAKIRWKWGVLAALAVTLLAIYPQVNLWLARGAEWQGSYVLVQGDEIAYSAYINALIDGRPRRNDTFLGRDDVPQAPLPESLFSIQFIPPYLIALPARALGIRASTAFIILILLTAIASTLAIFWLLLTITRDDRLAAAGALATLCFGTLAAGQGEAYIMLFKEGAYDFFPYLRRYQPSLSFPLFFIFCVFVWRALGSKERSGAIKWAVAAGLIFAVLVFSYFYLWTAAGAWLASLALLWLPTAARPEGRRQAVMVFGIIGALALAALVPFFMLLSRRAEAMDSAQLLSFSHAPELFYAPELIGFVVIIALAFAAVRGLIEWREPVSLFAASFALTPFILFNQQIITGRVLQPIHYQVFIGNYVALVALVLVAALLARGRSKETARTIPQRALILVALAAFAWGIVEVAGATNRNAAYARLRDDAVPVIARLAEWARAEGVDDPARGGQGFRRLAFSTNMMISGEIPTAAPVGVLWAMHTPATGLGLSENKELFYKQLYYSDITEQEMAQSLIEGRFYFLAALFGVERVITALAPDPKPITTEEMRAEVRRYSEFVKSFARERAAQPALSYVVTPTEAAPNFKNLDRWYERDAGERVGRYTIYHVRLKQAE